MFVGFEAIDSILEGILDNENSSSSSSEQPHFQELSPASSIASHSSENGPLQCIAIKSELPDSCSVDIMVSLFIKVSPISLKKTCGKRSNRSESSILVVFLL